MDDKIISQLQNVLLSTVKRVTDSATSYTIFSEQLEVFSQFIRPFKYGLAFTKRGTFSINYRATGNRYDDDGNPMTPGEYYKSTILSAVNNLPAYDPFGNWLSGEAVSDLSYKLPSLPLSRRLPSQSELIIGSLHLSDNIESLEILSLSDFLELSIHDRKYESFGLDSYCQIDSLVDFVSSCYHRYNRPVTIIELGPGIGYWINKACAQLSLKSIPFHVVAIDKFMFNSINTQRMAGYFHDSNNLTSIYADIHDLAFDRIFNFKNTLFSDNSIVIHSSGCVDPYIRPDILYALVRSLSRFRLFGGIHREGDGFLLLDKKSKSIYLKSLHKYMPKAFPSPFLGVTQELRHARNLYPLSYLDPSYESTLSSVLDRLSTDHTLKIDRCIPWQQLSTSPLHFTKWIVDRPD